MAATAARSPRRLPARSSPCSTAREPTVAESDRVLFAATLILVGIGLLCLAGSAHTNEAYFSYCSRQLLWGLAGLALMLAVSRLDYAVWQRLVWPLYGGTLAALLATTLFGATIRGSTSWISLGWFNVQTSEFAKVALALALAHAVCRRADTEWSGDYDRVVIRRLGAVLALGLPPLLLIILQSDLGTALTLLPMLLLALLFGGLPLGLLALGLGTGLLTVILSVIQRLARWSPAGHNHAVFITRLLTERELALPLFALLAVAALAAGYVGSAFTAAPGGGARRPQLLRSLLLLLVLIVLAAQLSGICISRLKPYQQQRLISFIDPHAQPLQGGYNVLQSKIAIGAGGLWGRGFGNGTQHRLGFLPEAHTDFIFAIWAEEWGLAGVVLLLAAYGLLARCTWRIAAQSRDRWCAAFTLIYSGGLYLQALFNLGMNLGLLPIMGVPLPLVSYGGSSLVSTLFGLGIILAIWRHRLAFRGGIS